MNIEKQKALRLLKTAKGQLEGIMKMIEEEKYCVDISNQISASSSLLKNAQLLILKQHMEGCVISAVKEDNGSEKIEEIMSILSKIVK
ncbi:MAG: metal-sensing transcriptional repressor [Brevinema sp.]